MMKATGCLYVDLPLTDYQEALGLQREITAARKEKRLDEDVVLALEHPPVFTLGRNGGRENLVVSEDFLDRMNIAVVQIERGGNITYHGPGQLVVYPILNLNTARLAIRDYVGCLEDAMIRTAAEWGVEAAGHPKNRGVWVGGRKLGSIGVSVTRGICFHGLALNINTSLTPFDWINPCGLHNIRMTSLENELGREVLMEPVRNALKRHLSSVLNKTFTDADLTVLKHLMKH
jgi:lipoate-protein ligase B